MHNGVKVEACQLNHLEEALIAVRKSTRPSTDIEFQRPFFFSPDGFRPNGLPPGCDLIWPVVEIDFKIPPRMHEKKLDISHIHMSNDMCRKSKVSKMQTTFWAKGVRSPQWAWWFGLWRLTIPSCRHRLMSDNNSSSSSSSSNNNNNNNNNNHNLSWHHAFRQGLCQKDFTLDPGLHFQLRVWTIQKNCTQPLELTCSDPWFRV